MKVLFVSSGNSDRGISPIVENQGKSLQQEGCEVSYYAIKGKGFWGYLRNVFLLRNFLKQNDFDLVHAHYSLSAFAVSLAGTKPMIVSLMGSDVKAGKVYKLIIRVFAFCFSWKKIIVKSEDMRNVLGIKNVTVIPNGVDFDRFRILHKKECQLKLGWNPQKINILFPANPKRYEKNFLLAKKTVQLIHDHDLQIHFFKNTPNTETPFWYNASDVVLLTSLWEGSPNAIKEAMACNRPIVATKVGDVEWLLNHEEGCFLTNFDVNDCAKQLKKAICFSKECSRTNGRQRISDLGLESKNIAKRIIEIYNNIL